MVTLEKEHPFYQKGGFLQKPHQIQPTKREAAFTLLTPFKQLSAQQHECPNGRCSTRKGQLRAPDPPQEARCRRCCTEKGPWPSR